ncbi:MAG: hypothetical protein R3F61_10175 [Myxococcota bacterium]
MLTLSEPLLDVLHAHLVHPLPMAVLRDHLRDGLGGKDADRVLDDLYTVPFHRYRPRTAWAQSVDHAVAKLERVSREVGGPEGRVRWADPDVASLWVARWRSELPPAPVGRRRRYARWLASLDQAVATLRRGRVLRICRNGRRDRVEREQLGACPWTAVATAVLPETLPGLHLVRARWSEVPWRARLLSRSREAEVLATWFAPPDVRSRLDAHQMGVWVGRLAQRVVLARAVEARDWRVEAAEERAWVELIAACTAERVGEVVVRLDAERGRAVPSEPRAPAFWDGFTSGGGPRGVDPG